jgi:hypothetical protein
MRARSAGFFLMVALASAPVLAATITIDPNNFSSGQVINAPGVTLETETFVQSGTDSTGNPLYAPTFSAVYSYNMGAGCMNGAYPCAVVGTSLFAPSSSGALPNTPNYGAGGFWGTQYAGSLAPDCSQNCVFGASAGADGAILLRLDFAHPTNFVDALGFLNGGDPTEITAFDSAGNMVGDAFNDTTGIFTGWADATVTTATPDISTVIIGGHDSFRGINVIDYSRVPTPAPEIDTASAASGLTLLVGGLVVLRGRRVRRADKAFCD